MTWELVLAALSLLAAIAGIVKWWLKGRKDNEALNMQKALNEQMLQHTREVRVAVEDADKCAEGGRHVSDRALAGELSRDELNRVRSGKAPDG